MLVEALQDLTEDQLNRWLAHSSTLRLSVVERLSTESEWKAFVAFVERYGADLFTQKFLNLGNLRAILHQRTGVWLSNLEHARDAPDIRLITELGKGIPREEAAKWLSLALEAVVENYREYRDYNTTTTHSDHGELLYTLIDFLRLRAELRPRRLELAPRRHGPRNPRPAQPPHRRRVVAASASRTHRRNRRRQTGPLRRALQSIRRSATERRRTARRTFHAPARNRPRPRTGRPRHRRRRHLRPRPVRRARARNRQPCPANRPAPASTCPIGWPRSKKKFRMVRCRRRHQSSDDAPRRIQQVRLSWDQWQRQIADDAA